MKHCRENHLEITWDEKESCWCPVCLLKQSQDYLRGEKEKYKNQHQKIKDKYEPQIRARDFICSDLKDRYKNYSEEEVINGLFFHDWTLNGISTKEKQIDYSRKGSILS